jgi:hypothetical protein
VLLLLVLLLLSVIHDNEALMCTFVDCWDSALFVSI